MLASILSNALENPLSQNPVFENGLPISTKEGHGYGTQSICYMIERLNGKYQIKRAKEIQHELEESHLSDQSVSLSYPT